MVYNGDVSTCVFIKVVYNVPFMKLAVDSYVKSLGKQLRLGDTIKSSIRQATNSPADKIENKIGYT